MKNNLKKTLKYSLLFSILFILGFLTYDRLFDIRLSNLIEPLPYRSEWELPPLSVFDSEKVAQILNQSFKYYGEGGQSYVFASRDQQYVLKLFKYKRFRPAWFVSLLPPISLFDEFRTRHITSRARKLTTVFQGHKVAYENIPEESGLVYVQLNPSHTPQMIKITDKLGFTKELDLGEVAFVIQKKGEMLRLNFSKLLKDGQVETVKERIRQIFAVYLSEYRKGIYDDDHGVMQNFGFRGKMPFHLDVGKFKIDESYQQPEVYNEDLIKVANRMQLWFKKYFPNYHPELLKDIEEQLSQILGKEYHFNS